MSLATRIISKKKKENFNFLMDGLNLVTSPKLFWKGLIIVYSKILPFLRIHRHLIVVSRLI